MNATLTKRQSLLLCIELWDWLAENPTKHKSDWPGWTEHTDAEAYNHCFACQYAEEQAVINLKDDICSLCPLMDYWDDGFDAICPSAYKTCMGKNSLYLRWSGLRGLTESASAAKRIADAARKALALLPPEENND